MILRCIDMFQVSVYAPEDQLDQAYFALDAAITVLEYFELFFGQIYPLPKLGKSCLVSLLNCCNLIYIFNYCEQINWCILFMCMDL